MQVQTRGLCLISTVDLCFLSVSAISSIVKFRILTLLLSATIYIPQVDIMNKTIGKSGISGHHEKKRNKKPKKKMGVEKKMQKLGLKDESTDCSCSDCVCSCSDCAETDSYSEKSGCSCSDCRFSSSEKEDSCSCSECAACDCSDCRSSDEDFDLLSSACALPPKKKSTASEKKKKPATKKKSRKSVLEELDRGACPLVKPKKSKKSLKKEKCVDLDCCERKKKKVSKPVKSKTPRCNSNSCH